MDPLPSRSKCCAIKTRDAAGDSDIFGGLRAALGAATPANLRRRSGRRDDVYQGGQSFDDVIQVELEFLHQHAKKAD
jgi:hypothetical protein